jgi:hypothetical protein
VVGVPYGQLVEVNGFETLYQGSPVRVKPGRYVIAGEVPTRSADGKLTSETLVSRVLTIAAGGTVRLDARNGRRLRVTLTGSAAQPQLLAAGACLSNATGGDAQLAEASAGGGPGVAVYAVPTRSRYVSFTYESILHSAAGATYYLVGASSHGIPSRLSYRQRAADLARVTMSLRTGVYASSMFDWGLTAGNDQSVCGGGQNYDVLQPQSWVTYLTPGVWTTNVMSYSEDANSNLFRNAAAFRVSTYRAHRAYSDVFGGAVAGPANSFPSTSADYPNTKASLQYEPVLFAAPGGDTGSLCCTSTTAVLRLGGRVVKRQTFSSACQSCFQTTVSRAGWYTLGVTARRWFEGGETPADLLSRRVAVSFRFHASPVPAGNGAGQNLPVTLARYDALGLDLHNRAPAGGVTTLVMQVQRPPDLGVRSPVYRLRTVQLLVSDNGGASWQKIALTRVGSSWQARIRDPASGYVSLRSIVTDVHGDSTEQTVYRAYAVG